MRALGRRIARGFAAAPPLAILFGAWLFLLVYAYPGLMTQDSFDHLREARERVYTDGHPPAIALLWKVVDYFVAGPFGMLVIQSTGFLAGLYLVLRRVFTPKRAAWITIAIFLFPPVFVPFSVIWKDPLMAAFLMLGFVALLSPRRGLRIAGLLAMFAATAVRYNALAATMPAIVLLFEWRPGMHWLKRYPIAVLAWLAVTLGAMKLNEAITDHKMYGWHTLAVYDIVGTLAFLDEDVSDDQLRTLFAGSDLLTERDIHARARELYTPRDYLPITGHESKTMWALPINGIVPPPEHQRTAITRAWKETLQTWPLAYLKHRTTVMSEVIGLGVSRASGAIAKRDYRWPEAAVALGLGTRWTPLQRKMTKMYVFIVRHTPFFTVWMYIALSLLLLPIAFRQRDTLALLLSGIGIESSLFVLAPTPDYRYSHWMVVTSIVAAIIIGVRRYRGTAASDPPRSDT